MPQYFCYLIKSVATQKSNATYIGFTTFPKRRLRQHNGEIQNGAYKTSKKRPWVHICVVGGFPNKRVALQFEWQWQHPTESRIIRQQVLSKSKRRGYKQDLEILGILIQCYLWRQLNLTVYFPDQALMKQYEDLIISGRPYTKIALSIPDGTDDLEDKVKDRNNSRPIEIGEKIHCSCQQDKRFLPTSIWQCQTCLAYHHVLCLGREASAEPFLKCRPHSENISTTCNLDRVDGFHSANKSDEKIVSLIPCFASCQSCRKEEIWSNIILQSRTTNEVHAWSIIQRESSGEIVASID